MIYITAKNMADLRVQLRGSINRDSMAATMNFDTEGMINFIKEMLSMDGGSIWSARRDEGKVDITFSGNPCIIKREIFNWLRTPGRIIERD